MSIPPILSAACLALSLLLSPASARAETVPNDRAVSADPAVPLDTAPAPRPGAADARGARFFRPEPGYVRAKDLPNGFRASVDSIRFAVMDAFEGADIHSRAERWAFRTLDRLHIETRKGTIRRRLHFTEGGEVTKGSLLETEKVLRSEDFLADAVLEVGPERGGGRVVKVTTYDQWTLAPIIGAQLVRGDLFTNLVRGRWEQIAEDEWIWGVGIWESNFLGTGTKLGGSLRHDLQRDTREVELSNRSFSPMNIQGSLYGAFLSDGHSYQVKAAKPLRSRVDRYAFSAALSSLSLSELLYFDANRLAELPDSLAGAKAGNSHILREYEGVTHDSVFLSATRSYGSRLKVNVGPTFFYQDRYQEGGLGEFDTALAAALPPPPSSLGPRLRTDALLGAALSVYQYDYKTARNFRNLKWNETVETGWRLTARAAWNQEWLGAGNSDFWLAHEAAYGRAWRETFFASCSLSANYFLSPGGDLEDGRLDASLESQWKPHPITSTYFAASWSNLFATPASRQLVLGASEGLSGFPSFYFAGQARFLAALEQRLFPEVEWATLVPAFSAFLAAGNTFPAYGDFDASDLHYSLGAGLRLGKSKSVTKGVQHINVSWPLGEKGIQGPAVSILARKSL